MRFKHQTSLPFAVAVAVSALFALPAIAQHEHGMSKDKESHHDMSGEMHGDEPMGHSHDMSMIHGGHVTMTKSHHFEVLHTEDAMRVYMYGADQKPILDPAKAEVLITLKRKDKDDVALKASYVPPDQEKGRLQGYFAADYDFGSVEDGSMKALVRVDGLDDKPIEFRTPVVLGKAVSYACPMACQETTYADPMPCPKCGMQMTPVETPMHMDEKHHGDEGAGEKSMHSSGHQSHH